MSEIEIKIFCVHFLKSFIWVNIASNAKSKIPVIENPHSTEQS